MKNAVASADAPALPTFDVLPLTPEVRSAVDAAGFVHPTPVQVAAYGPAVEHRDLLVQAQTGTGKTAAFGLPLVDRLVRPKGGLQALILAPTRELALQISRELSAYGKGRDIQTLPIYGGVPLERQANELRAGAPIVAGTPGRVLDHLRRGTMNPANIRVLVLDEADEMLSMGFLQELTSILELLPKTRQTLLFSATVDEQVRRMSERYMRDPSFLSLSSDAVGARGITHSVYMVTGKGRGRDLIRIIEVEDPESAIVFCNTKAETESVAAELQDAGFRADWLNGDLPQNEREKIMARTRRGDLRYLVATDVAARGIDISHLTHVFNFALPESPQQYIHRTGRTGRAGRTGHAVSLISPQELGNLYQLRLQYRIALVERSLPTAGQLRTRQEADRVAMLQEAFQTPLSDLDRAVANRLLTHPEAERLVGGLIHAFFGALSSDVDEVASAARRSRIATPSLEDTPTPRPPRRTSRDETQRDARPDARAETRSERPRRPRRAEPPTAPLSQEPRRPSAPTPRPSAKRKTETRRADEPATGTVENDGRCILYLNVGRRDGLSADELSSLLSERCGLDASDIGPLRVRERYTFVSIPDDRAPAVLTHLAGHQLHGKELVIERAKGVVV